MAEHIAELTKKNRILLNKIEAQGKLIAFTNADCEERIQKMTLQHQKIQEMMEIGYTAKDGELKVLKGELDQSRTHMFTIHSQMSSFHESLMRSSPSAVEAKEKFLSDKKRKQSPS